MKDFQHWLYQEVEETFDLRRNNELPLLLNWIGTDIAISEKNKTYVKELQKDLLKSLKY